MDSDLAISVKNIQAGYGHSHILFGVDFEVRKNNIAVIVGPNGGGKSTLLKSIFGLCTIHGGTIEYFGQDITKKPPHAISRMSIAYLPQINNVFANLSITENLQMAGYALDKKTKPVRIARVLDSFSFLQDRLDHKAASLSGGQRQMLAMAMALIREPKIMLFDEPTANLSPKMAGEIIKKIIQMREEFNTTVILVEQNVRRALEFGDSVCLIANGKVAYSGLPKDLAAHPDLSRMYLGANQNLSAESTTSATNSTAK